jgi:hypothetical protein
MTQEHEMFLQLVKKLFPNLEHHARDALRQEGGDIHRAVQVTVDRCREELSQAEERFARQEIELLRAKCRGLTLYERVETIHARAEALCRLSAVLAFPEFANQMDIAVLKAERLLRFETAIAASREGQHDIEVLKVRLVVAHVQRELAPAVTEIAGNTAVEVEKLLHLAEADHQFLVGVLRLIEKELIDSGSPEGWASQREREAAVRPLLRRLHQLPIGELSKFADAQKWLEEEISQIQEYLPPPPPLSRTLSPSRLSHPFDSFTKKVLLPAGERMAWGIHDPVIVIEQPEGIRLPVERLGSQNIQVVVGSPYEIVIRAFTWKPLQALHGFEKWIEADRELQGVYKGIVGNSAEPWRAAEQDRLIGRTAPRRSRGEIHTHAATGGTTDGLALESDWMD